MTVFTAYGKLPAHGDFITRSFATGPQGVSMQSADPQMMQAWDQWLKAYAAVPQQNLGHAWLDIYLTSPVWQFVVSAGILSPQPWAGLLIPSVDKVGRYFPMTLLMSLNQHPIVFLTQQADWFAQLETSLLDALEHSTVIDEWLPDVLFEPEQVQYQAGPCNDPTRQTVIRQDQSIDVTQVLLANLYNYMMPSYSLWQTQGSDEVAACTLSSKHLPAANSLTAMLDGQWERWNWQSGDDPAPSVCVRA